MHFARSFLVIPLGLALSCGVRPGPSSTLITVTSETSSDDSGIQRLRFSAPMVDQTEVARPLPSAPVQVEPALELAAHWEDRQTLVLRPTTAPHASTRYEVRLVGQLASRVGDAPAFAFVWRPLEIDGLSGVDPGRVPPRPELTLHFNQPVRAEEAARSCRIEREDGTAVAALAVPTPGAASTETLSLVPSEDLPQGADLVLACRDLRGDGGNVGLETPFTTELHTYAAAGIASFEPAGDDVPADEVKLTITFATPVSLDAVAQALSSRPRIQALGRGWLDSEGTTYTVETNLDTTTDYEVRLAGGMKDVFGQVLSKGAQSWSFHTGDARPRLGVETGIFAVEPKSSGYPVWTRNLRGFDLDCGRIPTAKLVKLLTSDMDYDPWSGSDTDHAIDFASYGAARKHHTVRLADAKNKWHLENLPLGRLCGGDAAGDPHGVFLAELHSDEVDHQDSGAHERVLANVTDLGLLLKAGPSSGLIWVTSIATAAPVSGAAVAIWSPQGKKVWSGTTDGQGIVRLPGTTKLLGLELGTSEGGEDEDFEEEYDSYRAQRLIAVVEKDGDVAVVDGNWQNGIQIWNFGVPEDRASGLARIRGLIQSDRGIYRPGETVHFKGIVRAIELGREARMPAQKKISVQVEDSQGTVVFDSRVALTPFGGFSFDLPLTAEARLGDYHVNATIDRQTFRERFMVEEFRKVEFELGVSGAERDLRLGSRLEFKVDASYLFGAPVKHGQVTWSIQRRAHALLFPKFPEFGFGDWAAGSDSYWWWGEDEAAPLSFVSEGEGTTDDRGRFRFAFRDPEKQLTGPQDYVAHVDVTDATSQTISKQVAVTAHRSDFYFGLHAQEFVQAVDMPFAVNLVALAPDGTQVAAKGTLAFVRRVSQCSWSDGWRAYPDCKTSTQKTWSKEVDIPSTGVAVERILPKLPGEYVVRLDGTDGRGNPVAASTYVYVIGKGEAFWSGDESARMSLVASKATYLPGETARVVPRTSLPGGTALVTLERNGILDAYVTEMKSSGEGLEIPLTAAHAPNVYASVALVKGRTGDGDRGRPRFQMGVVDLRVSAEKQALTVDITADHDKVEPGAQVSGTIRVTSDGKPVRAEIALSVADEGVLQLIAYKTPDPLKAFYAPWGLGIDSSTTWNRIARVNDPGEVDPEEGGDSGEGPAVRSRFVSSAYWAPALVTDERGEVAFRFQAPDNLTAFRIMAVVADAGAKFGSAEHRITVSKPLLVQPILPRFLRAGDRAEVGLVVHNYTGQAGEVTVTAKSQGVRLDRKSQVVTVDADGQALIRFEANVGSGKVATFELGASVGAAGGASDAVRISVPIERPLVIDREVVAAGAFQGSTTIPLTWGPGLAEDDSYVEVSVDRTGLAEVGADLAYLVEYPYGCLEQTLSRLIPLAKVQDLSESLGMKELQGSKLAAFLRVGVAKVVRHQHEDGNFSLWPQGETHPHLTAYALYGLNEARRAGIEIDRAAVDRGVSALTHWLNDSARTVAPGGEGGTMAMAAFVLADLGRPDAGLNARLYEARRGLPVYGRAFLLRAMALAKAPAEQVRTLKDELTALIVVSGESAMVKETGDPDERLHYFSTDARSTAIVLSALLLVDPEAPLVPKLVEGLKKLRRSDGRWDNTQDNLYALVALSDWARRAAAGQATVTISAGGARLSRETLKGGRILEIRRSLAELRPGTLTVESDAKVRYSVRLVSARNDPSEEASDHGFQVTREYRDPETGAGLSEIKAGQLVKVHVEVTTPETRAWVAVVDPLPAGFEAVNPELDASEPASPTSSGYGWTHFELRDDRAEAFSDDLRAGTWTLDYLARATLAGDFTAGPATAEAMYDPEAHGRSGPVHVKVKR